MIAPLIFREATPADLPRLLELEQRVVEYERPFNSSIKAEGVKYYDLEDLISNVDSTLLVAEVADTVIGTGYAQIRASKASLAHSRHAYLGFMFVSPDHRGSGIAQALIDRLTAWSLSRGISDIYLHVYAQNESAIRAYSKAGFEPSLLEMKLSLDV